MSQNLKLRIITGLSGFLVILGLLIYGGVEGVSFLSWVISMGMLYEFCRMFFNLEDANRKTAMALICATALHVVNYVLNPGLTAAFFGLAPAFTFSILFVLMVPRLLNYRGSEALETIEGKHLLSQHVHELMALCFGFVYCVWFPMTMVAVREMPEGKVMLLFGLLIVWANDTFAYFGGKYLGKNKLFETVSPKKTMEGAATGVGGAIAIGIGFLQWQLHAGRPLMQTIVILTLSAASIVGDLAESLMKRASGKKDSGSILPGHGGFLDRFDGVVFAIPLLYAWLWLFGRGV